MNLDQIEEVSIDHLGRLGRRLAILHQWFALSVEIRTPGFSGFIQRGIREDVVEEDLFRDFLGPRKFLSGLEGQRDVLHQEISAEASEILGRHPRNKKLSCLHSFLSKRFASPFDEGPDLASVLPRRLQGGFQILPKAGKDRRRQQADRTK